MYVQEGKGGSGLGLGGVENGGGLRGGEGMKSMQIRLPPPFLLSPYPPQVKTRFLSAASLTNLLAQDFRLVLYLHKHCPLLFRKCGQ